MYNRLIEATKVNNMTDLDNLADYGFKESTIKMILEYHARNGNNVVKKNKRIKKTGNYVTGTQDRKSGWMEPINRPRTMFDSINMVEK